MKARFAKCSSCGKQHVSGFAFCQRCGAPLGAEPSNDEAAASDLGDGDREEAVDLNARILGLLERGKRKEAVRLYHDALGGDIKMAEAAIGELAKNVEFDVVRSTSLTPASREQPRWFGGCVAAIRMLMGFDRG